MHADRIRGRCDDAADGVGIFPGGDNRGVHGNDAGASGGVRPPGGVLLGPVRCVPGQQEGQGERVDAVPAGAQDAGHRLDPRGQPAGEGARGTGEPNASGSVGEGDAAARDRRHGGGQRVPAGVHGGLQRAFRGGAEGPGGRAPESAARDPGAGPDIQRAPCAQADEESFDPIRVPRVPGDGAGPGLPASRRGGHGVRGVRWVGDGCCTTAGSCPFGCSPRARRRFRWRTKRRFGGGWTGPRRNSDRARPTSRRRITPGGGH